MREQKSITQLNQENNTWTNKKFSQETEFIKKKKEKEPTRNAGAE